MGEYLSFFVPGIPRPGGSKTAFRNRYTGRVQMVDAGKDNKEWRSMIGLFAHQAMAGRPLIPEAIRVEVVFQMPRPKSHYGKAGLKAKFLLIPHTSKPDATKLWRAAEDALTGVVWHDDSQITRQLIDKKYDEKPGMLIKIFVEVV